VRRLSPGLHIHLMRGRAARRDHSASEDRS